LLYATLPGVSFSALVISTDVPLLFFWAVALLATWRILDGAGWSWALALGAAFGLGFLSKYAMGYFLLGFAIYALATPSARLKTAAPKLAAAAILAAIIAAPNVVWNATHGWATVGHTAANANWGQGGAHLFEAASFAAAQFGVFGPVLLIALILRLALWRRDPPAGAERYLLAFSAPILALMIVQSGVSRAHANWAAVSYVAATVLVVAWLDRLRKSWPIRLALVLQVAAFAAFTVMFSNGAAPRLPWLSAELRKSVDIFHQMRGWKPLANDVYRRMESMPPDASAAADDREVMAELDYTLRDRAFPLVMATGHGPPGNQYELEDPVTGATGEHVLLVARYQDRRDILDRFDHHTLTDEWTISIGPGRMRRYFVYELSGFTGN
jgi:4-amino-4-deoxy-L-arabinose transferase-like glycosyltransferase